MRYSLRRFWIHLSAFFAITLKQQMAYTAWFWADILGQVVVMAIGVAFWSAVYAVTPTVGGLDRQQTIAYVLAANVVGLVVSYSMVPDIGYMLQSGSIATELTRPVDFQLRMYATKLAEVGSTVIKHLILLGAAAWLLYGFQPSTDLRVWLWFLLSLLVGNAVLFFSDWIFSLAIFYTTEVRGLLILRDGIASFFSGLMIPLPVLPQWLQDVAAALPFGQILHTPVSIITGVIPVSEAPRALVGQLCWLVGLILLSRPLFHLAVRRVTVQGG